MSAAAERAEEVQTILGAWSDAPGDMRKTDANAALLERVRDSKTLQDISRYLGRFREIFAQGKRNGDAYGRGEKYALELGNDLSRYGGADKKLDSRRRQLNVHKRAGRNSVKGI